MSVLQVIKAIVPSEVIDTMEAQNMTDFVNKTVTVLNAYRLTASLRLKTVYIKDKVTVPLHSRFTWIENMQTEESKIQLLPRDMLTPPVQENIQQAA